MRIVDLYAGPRPVFSLEFYTPRTEAGHRALWRNLAELKALEPGYVSVTCGAAGTTRGPTAEAVIRIQRDFGLLAMPHLVCTGTTCEQVLVTLELLEEQGVENVLALRGDPPRDEPEWRPVPGGLRHANELAAFIRERFEFGLGGACYPEKHHEAPSLEEDLRYLKQKVDAGVEFLITQVFFDDAVYWRFVERARALGIGVPIVPGIMPLRDLANLERIVALSPGTSVPAELRERLAAAGDDEERALAEGAAWAARQVRGLLAGGAPGIHYYTLNLAAATTSTHRLVGRP